MYKLRRLYLDAIGVDDNRFTDISVGFTDAEGSPTDSIIWLRNGAGKTTMMSLLLALIRPEKRDFLSYKLQKRTLTDLVQPGDTSHVVAEWVGPDGRRLLTGAIYEWDGRQRPTDYHTGGYKRFSQTWWCMNPDDDVEGATLDSLPFTYRSRGTYDREKFTAHLWSLADQGVDLHVVTVIKQWHEALRERNFDPELFTYFVEVNSAEGGMKNLFKGIDSAGAFVNYLLRFVADPNQIRPVHELLESNAAEFMKRPMYEAEKTFCDEAKIKVSALGASYSDREAAQQTLDHERTRAATYKKALLNESDTAAESKRITESRKTTVDEQLKVTRGDLDLHRLRATYYRMKSAEFAEQAAKTALEQAQNRAEAARITKEAWTALDLWTELQTRQQQLDVRQQLLAEKKEGAKPLQERLKTARGQLAGAIQTAETQVRKELEDLEAEVEQLEAERETAQNMLDELYGQIAGLNAEQDAIHSTQARFEESKRDFIARGVIAADEDLAAAAARIAEEGTAAAAALERIALDKADIDKQITAAGQESARLFTELAAANAEHTTVAKQLQSLKETAATLASSARLHMLMQNDAINIGAEITDAIAAVGQARADDDKKILEVQEAVAADERALLALKTEGLLPPRLQVQKVVDQLNAVGVTAVSGWRYLAANKRTEQHAAIISALPAVVDGVIVYTADPAAAASHIRVPIDEAVVVASAAVFEQDLPEPYLVLGPAPAQHDETAASKELLTRTATHDGLLAERDAITARRGDDDTLLSNLRVFQRSLPEDGLRGLENRVTAAEQHKAATQIQVDQKTKDKAALEEQRERLLEDQREQDRRKNGAETNHRVVQDLARQEADDIVPNASRLERIPAERTRCEEQRRQTRRSHDSADTRRGELLADKEQKKRRGNSLRAELQLLPTPQTTKLPLEAARTGVADANQHLKDKFPEDALIAAISDAEKEAARVSEAWNDHGTEVRERALELAKTSAAGDPADRRVAADGAQSDYSAANRGEGEAGVAFTAAQEKLSAATNTFHSRERKGRREFERQEPSDGAHAEELADEDDNAVETLDVQRWKLEQQLDIAKSEADRHGARAQLLLDLAERITIDAAEASAITVPLNDDEIRAAVAAIVADLTEAEDMAKGAENAFDGVCDQIVRWASSDRFARVAEDENGEFVRVMRELLRDKEAIHRHRVASTAETTIADLSIRAARIVEQLEQVEVTKANVAAKLSDLVADALNSLARASKLSEFPEGVGAWDGKRFIEVAPKANPTHEQIAVRVGTLIDTMVNGKVEQNPVQLLWMATNAAVPEGFKAKILKPTPEQSATRLDVAEMQKWSGGENLTASVILYCVLARMRAEKRSREKNTALGGVLPMDNPIGTANLRDFLVLHRKVARANGVQLAYWTGLGDLGAITVFPRIVAMRKRPSHTRQGRFYVDVEEEIVDSPTVAPGQELESIASVRRES